MALTAVTTLTGCLSAWLWERDESTLPLHYQDDVCKIVALRGVLQPGGDTPNQIIVDFVSRPDRFTPQHLAAVSAGPEGHGRLILRPPDHLEGDWLRSPGASWFEVDSLNFRTYRGDYFSQSGVNALVTLGGSTAVASVIQVTATTTGEAQDGGTTERRATDKPVPTGPTVNSRLPTTTVAGANRDLAAKLLKGLHTHDWIQLLGSKSRWTEYRSTPMAVDLSGERVPLKLLNERLNNMDAARREKTLRDAWLLVRLDGIWDNSIHVRIAAPILLQGSAVRLTRRGSQVAWSRAQVWSGDEATARSLLVSAMPELALSRQPHSFRYRYATEIPPATLLQDLVAAILTPAAVLLDVAWITSGVFGRLREWILGRQKRSQRRTR